MHHRIQSSNNPVEHHYHHPTLYLRRRCRGTERRPMTARGSECTHPPFPGPRTWMRGGSPPPHGRTELCSGKSRAPGLNLSWVPVPHGATWLRASGTRCQGHLAQSMAPTRTVTNSGCPSSAAAAAAGLGLSTEPRSTTYSRSSLPPVPEVQTPGLNDTLLFKKTHPLSKTRPQNHKSCLVFTPFPAHRPSCPHMQTCGLPSVSPAEPPCQLPTAILWALALLLT